MDKKCNKKANERRSWRKSEDHVINKISKERGEKFETQVSFKDRKKSAGAGSVKPDGFHKGPPPVSIEVKNYKKENYSSMKSTLKKQRDDRKKNLPKGTIQEAHIDIKGQNLSEKEQINLIKAVEEIHGKGNVYLHED